MVDARITRTEQQIDIAAALSIDVRLDSFSVAAAKILDAVAPAVSEKPRRPATDRQIAFAQSLGLEVSNESARVAGARIHDELYRRNMAALDRLDLKPGDLVVHHQSFVYEGRRFELEDERVISSIGPDGRVFFKGGNGLGGWPTDMERAKSNTPESRSVSQLRENHRAPSA